MWLLPLVVGFFHLIHVNCQDISPLADMKVLSELPLEKLLQVKETLEEKIDSDKKTDYPKALALHNQKQHHYHHHPADHEHYYEEEQYTKSDKKSVQTIFQISITTLAFLAFGGYLLCLLVHAIRGKTMSMTTIAPTIMAAFIQAPVKRRKPIRRPIFRPNRPHRPKRDLNLDDFDSEQMYFALVHLSEAYTTYHTVDYKKFNYSSSYT